MKVVWFKRAVADLVKTRAFIAQDDSAAASRVANQVKEQVSKLVEFPGMGRPGRVCGTRELVIVGTPLIVPYRVRDNVVEILRVLHGARRYP